MSLNALLRGLDYGATPAETNLRTHLGGLLAADWRTALISRGYGWNVTVGTLSTGITGGGAGTTIALAKPEFGLSVPTGYCLIPLDFRIQARIGLQTTDSHTSEILIAVDRAAAWAGDGTVTSETPLNLRTNTTGTCPLTCFSAATANITSPTLSFELARKEALTDVQGTAATVNVYQFDLLYEPKNPPLIIGPACVYGYWGGSIAVVGFAQLNFLAIASTLVSALA